MADSIDRSIWPTFTFTTKEHLTSVKLNNFAQAIDEIRKTTGPFSLRSVDQFVVTGTQWETTATGLTLEFTEDAHELGFAEKSATGGNKLTPIFRILHYDSTMSVNSGGYILWKDVTFQKKDVEGTDRWICKFIEGNQSTYGDSTLHSGSSVDFTTLDVANFKCMIDYYQT